MKKITRAKAPLRLSFAGGGTDISPYCDFYTGAIVNVTIDKYAYATIEDNTSSSISFHLQDKMYSESFDLDNFYNKQSNLILLKEIYKYAIKNYNNSNLIPVRITTFCDAPAGSGLGSSSALVVACLTAFLRYFEVDVDKYEIAKAAYQIERINAKLQGGRQDQIASVYGGLNFVTFGKEFECSIQSIDIDKEVCTELESSIVLYFSGTSRESAKIIDDQSKNIINKDLQSINAMHALKQEATNFRNAIKSRDLNYLIDSIKTGWEFKKQTSRAVSNEKINSIYEIAMANGALAGKVSGAGGGGFMWFYADINKKIQLMNKLRSLDGDVSSCHFTHQGAESWVV